MPGDTAFSVTSVRNSSGSPARLTAMVVLPTPPFWLAIAITRALVALSIGFMAWPT